MTKRLLLSIIVLLTMASTSQMLFAQNKKPAWQPKVTNNKSAWTVNCANPGSGMVCKLSQRIILKKTGQLFLGITVQKSNNKHTMLIQLPHGLFLPAGVLLKVDKNKPTKLVIQTCDNKGCFAGMPLSAQIIKALQKGNQLNIQFQNLKKKLITVPLPLKGFSDGYKKL